MTSAPPPSSLERALVRPPVEGLARVTRNTQKLVEQELRVLSDAVEKLKPGGAASAKKKKADGGGGGGGGAEKALQTLQTLQTRLQGLKRKLDESDKLSTKFCARAKMRLHHLEQLDGARYVVEVASALPEDGKAEPESNGAAAASSSAASSSYSPPPGGGASAGGAGSAGLAAPPPSDEMALRVRLDRYMVDYLLREGLLDTAAMLAEECDIKELTELELFQTARQVLQGLEAGDCTKALQWCVSNRSKLKRMNSSLEFDLRLQQFVELVREGKLSEAVAHAREHLAPEGAARIQQVQEAMCALAFAGQGSWGKYEYLFDKARWLALCDKFREELRSINGLGSRSNLEVCLGSGLAALKAPVCGLPEHSHPNCPTCSPLLARLASSLPVAHRSRTSLVCRISGEVMDEHNPPLMLPNGMVYSKKALTRMAELDGGRVTCPRTQTRFQLAECRNVYIV